MNDETVRAAPAGIAAAGLSHPGWKRKRNEDAFFIHEGDPELAGTGAWHLIGVADGVGGNTAGDVASELALDALETALAGFPASIDALGDGWREDLEARLRAAVATAHEVVQENARRHPDRSGMATTLVAAVFSRGWLGVVHVGDSRAYLARGGKAHRLTADHSWSAEALEQGALDPAELERSPLRHSITRAVGLSRGSDPDVAWLRLEPGDVVVLASDGLTRYVDGEGILAVLDAAPRLEAAAAELVRRALEAGGVDNVTVVLARFDGLAAGLLAIERSPAEPPGP